MNFFTWWVFPSNNFYGFKILSNRRSPIILGHRMNFESIRTVPDLHPDWNNCRNNLLRILHSVQDEFSFYLLIYNEFDQGYPVRPIHPDWNLQTLPPLWNQFCLRLLKFGIFMDPKNGDAYQYRWKVKNWVAVYHCRMWIRKYLLE